MTVAEMMVELWRLCVAQWGVDSNAADVPAWYDPEMGLTYGIVPGGQTDERQDG